MKSLELSEIINAEFNNEKINKTLLMNKLFKKLDKKFVQMIFNHHLNTLTIDEIKTISDNRIKRIKDKEKERIKSEIEKLQKKYDDLV